MKTDRPYFDTIYETINYHAMQQPDSVAITAPNRHALTFKALKDRVDTIASILGGINADKKLRIAIIMPNGPEMAVAFLAVSSFAAAAPLNPQHKVSDLEFYLSDLKADAVECNHLQLIETPYLYIWLKILKQTIKRSLGK